MDSNRTTAERERAYARFQAVSRVHNAAIEAFKVVAALPEAPELIYASIHLRLGMKPDLPRDQVDAQVTRILETLAEEKARDYEVIRTSALVAVCGAFEYLIKATFVDQAAGDLPRAAGLLARAKVRLSAADILAASPSDQWFSIADRLFEHLAEAHPQMYNRVERFLLDFTCLPMGDVQVTMLKDALKKVDPKRFNEAFLVRNCVVHNGARVSAQLARASGLRAGDTISLSRSGLQPMLKPIRDLAEALDTLSWVI